MNNEFEQYINTLAEIAIRAGHAIMQVYTSDDHHWNITHKDDNSPLTLADKRSHEVISDNLQKAYPHIPVLSEEGKSISYEIRKDWEYYWCVDPLDGTKEFLAKNGQFTVNIALIHKNTPVLGVIYIPATDILYHGIVGRGAFRLENEKQEQIRTNPKSDGRIAVGSRSHQSVEESAFLNREGITQLISVGSSLKFCYVAEGRAQVYYRHGPTMEWDTAAGHAILLASGGMITDVNGREMVYNKESLLNPGFICRA